MAATKFRLAVGLMGDVASMLLYAAPIITFTQVIRKKSIGEFSFIPYTVALLNCLVYALYGLPVVSHGWDNFPVVIVNGVGSILELSFIIMYLWFASAKQKLKVGIATMMAILVFIVTVAISLSVFHDHHGRQLVVGNVALLASIALYASPLVAMKKVVETKSVEYMPLGLSFFSFLNSLLWMAYGVLSRDVYITVPNLVGCPLGMLQLVMYLIYRNRKRGTIDQESPAVPGVEKDNEKGEEIIKILAHCSGRNR